MHGLTRRGAITHDAIIDVLISQPTLTYRQLGQTFGYTPEGIGVICRSDAFKARMEIRKEELVDPIIKQTLEDRLVGVAHASIDILMEKLSTSEDPKLALAALDSVTRSQAAAYGARQGNVMGNTTFVVQLPGPAQNSAEWSRAFSPVVAAPAAVVIENAA